MGHILLLFAFLAPATQAVGPTEVEKGFAGALRGCEEWVLNPASWAEGVGPFVKTVGLGDRMGMVDRVDEVSLPPPQLRRGNHYWRINSTTDAGYMLVVSDQLGMCHITGGGDTDLQPAIETVIASSDFAGRWRRMSDLSRGEMASTEFRSLKDPKFSMVISRAKEPGGRRDRVQVIATATYMLDE